MTFRNKLAGTCALLLLGVNSLGAAPALSTEYGNLYSFGDSLTDTGNLFALSGGATPPPPYVDGRFSNGKVWVEYFSPRLGLDTDYSVPFTNNWAIGGAFTGAAGTAGTGTGVLSQIGGFAANAFGTGTGSIDDNDLVTVWAGANDIAFQASTPKQSVANLATAVTALNSLGAETIMVFNLPDLGRTPDGRASGAAPFLTAASATHNGLLSSSMARLEHQLDIDIVLVDIHTAFNQILANPKAFGFTNTTDPCLDRVGGTICSFDAAVQNTYLSWDGYHPTTAAHELIAEFAAATLNGPSKGTLMLGAVANARAASGKAQGDAVSMRLDAARLGFSGFGLLGNGFAGASLLEQRLAMATDNSAHAATTGETWLALSPGGAAIPAGTPRLSAFVYSSTDDGSRGATTGAAGFGYTAETRSFGMDYRLSDKVLVGMMYGQTGSAATIEEGAAADIVSNGISLYGAYGRDEGFFTNASLGVSEDRYESVRRSTGSRLFPTAVGSTSGSATRIDIESGYGFGMGGITFGPTTGLVWSRSEIDDYAETGAGPLNLAYDNQTHETMAGRLGFEAAGTLKTAAGPLAVEFGAVWSRDLVAEDSVSSASLAGDTVSGNTVALNAGAAKELVAGVDGSVVLTSSFNEIGDDTHEGRVSLNIRF